MTTTDEMNNLAQKIAELRKSEADASDVKKKITAELETYETEMLNKLQDSGLTSYPSPYGTASLSFLTSVKTPKTPEDIEALAEYCKSIGKYQDVFKPGSAAVNSFYKEQLELAKEKGAFDIEIPGLKEVTMEPRLSFRKAR